MKPCYARLICGAYQALHLGHWFAVVLTDRPSVTGYEVVVGAPGQEDLTVLYTWSSYPAPTDQINRDGEIMSGNEAAAENMLGFIVGCLSEGRNGILDMDTIARMVAQELGLEVRDGS